ncbi:hypothetical protein Tco_0594427, partial [Tanacetum coccineum]
MLDHWLYEFRQFLELGFELDNLFSLRK